MAIEAQISIVRPRLARSVFFFGSECHEVSIFGLSLARSPPKRALSPCGGISPCGGTGRSAWHAKSRKARTQMARMLCAAVAWVFARVLCVRAWLVRGCWRGCKGGRMRAGFGGSVYNLGIAVLRAAEEIILQHRVDERVVLLLSVVVRAVGALVEARVVCLRDGA